MPMTDEEWRQSEEGKASIERATRTMPFPKGDPLKALQDIRELVQRQATTGRIFETKKTATQSRKVSTEVKSTAHSKRPTDTEFLRKFTEGSSTTIRRKFFNSARDQVISLRKKQGRNVSVIENPGQGTIISVDRKKGATPSGCVFIQTADFTCGLCFAGFLYTAGDVLILPGVNGQGDGTICPPGTSPTFQLHVDTVDGSGAVTGITIIPGIGFSIAPSSPQAFSGGTGFAFIAALTFA